MPRLDTETRRRRDAETPRHGDAGRDGTRSVAASPRRRVTRSLLRRGEDPRALALQILDRVERTQAYANVLLDACLRKSELARTDRALVTELTYGVLRRRGMVDWALAHVLDRPLKALDPTVRQILRLGAYQLCCLTRVPDFAAVDEAVRLARRTGAGRTAGYVNAVLRALARRRGEPEPDRSTDPIGYWQSVGSHPQWLVERWMGRLGGDEAGELMAANNAVPPVTVLANTLKTEVERVRYALGEAIPDVNPGRWVPGAFSVRGAGGVMDLPGFAEGWLIPMDEAGALPVLALDLSPGQRVLDACAGGGSKSALIAGQVRSTGEVVAVDRSPRAVRRLEGAIGRLGLAMVRPHLGDARAVGNQWPGQFARVLLDAPCTGLGTIRRRPEIRWRRQPADLGRAAAIQRGLLDGVAPAVAQDGILVYSTCSMEPEETDEIMGAFLAAHPEFRPEDPRSSMPQAAGLVDAQGFVRAWPHRHGTDGFFVARLRRVG